ncbi:MAG: CocE/NonD family hydrolase [Bacteroidales bacterium]|nr:CocE/NonD family hydrolase [Bacteroidales bacterium]
MTLILALCALSACAGNPEWESLSLETAEKTTFDVSVDGAPVSVTRYVDEYVTRPNRPQDQKINIYVPETATKASPIILYVNNAGWRSNSYPENTLQEGRDYDGASDKVGVALKEGYVVVSYGGRSRSDGLTDGKYLGHSPAIMVDTKAVIRYLRFNGKALPAGDPEKIIVTGTSGGGALSTVIAASGNSEDYYPGLYEIGAAGIRQEKDGSLSSVSGMGDNVLGVIAYCPITDLGHSCYAYEWLFGEVRKTLYASGEMNYSYADQAAILAASEELAARYVPYVEGLGLKDEEGNAITADNLRDQIVLLMKEEIDKTLAEQGAEKMKQDIAKEIRTRGFRGPRPGDGGPGNGGPGPGVGGPGPGNGGPGPEGAAPDSDPGNGQSAAHRTDNGWLVFNADGSYEYDLDKHLLYLARYTALKPAPAFSNLGMYENNMNEDDLFGTEDQDYAPFNACSWNNDRVKNGVGKDDTGLDWDAYMETEEGKALALQIKMASAIDYLRENTSDTAPFWYVRHGMDDRDNSFAVETTLFLSVKASPRVKDANVGFAWLEPHGGDYDVPEAYSWLKGIL